LQNQVLEEEMGRTVPAIYEQGVLRPLRPLQLPEHTRVQVTVLVEEDGTEEERSRVRKTLLDAGVIRLHPPAEVAPSVSERRMAAAAKALGHAGPLSELIIAERDGR
jgi:predicted DNA-binding antitoxin AbrB/MazE fold protein